MGLFIATVGGIATKSIANCPWYSLLAFLLFPVAGSGIEEDDITPTGERDIVSSTCVIFLPCASS